MKIISKAFFLAFAFLFIVYLSFPLGNFPKPPADARQSEEEGDNETPLRRAYFTDYTRNEVLDHYLSQFRGVRLNYPPEESQFLIRDQTRSTFLEEIVQPFRGSVFVNGFEPLNAKDDVWYKGVDYRQKIIVKYVPSSLPIRILLGICSLAAFWLVIKSWGRALIDFRKVIWRR